MSVFNSKNKNGERYLVVNMVDGIENIKTGNLVALTLLDDGRLKIKEYISRKDAYYLNYSQIKNVGIINKADIKEEDKSVVGRAVVGGLLLGPLGAVVGGVSGIGKKQIEEYKNFIIINYISSESSEQKVLSFSDRSGNFPNMIKKFVRDLRIKVGLPEKEEKEKINHNL